MGSCQDSLCAAVDDLSLFLRKPLGQGPGKGRHRLGRMSRPLGRQEREGVQTELSMSPSLASARFPSSHYSS